MVCSNVSSCTVCVPLVSSVLRYPPPVGELGIEWSTGYSWEAVTFEKKLGVPEMNRAFAPSDK